MEHIASILLILPIHFAVMVSPGPNFVLLSTTALSISRVAAVQAAFGFAVGSLIWMVAAALGISAILQALPTLGVALKIAGGAYLIYLGVKLWLLNGDSTESAQPSLSSSTSSSFMRGLFVNLTSPKSVVYFGSIFATFLSDSMSFWLLSALIGSFFLMSIAWHVAIAVLFSTQAVRAPYIRFSKIINRVAGSFLVIFGVRMIGNTR